MGLVKIRAVPLGPLLASVVFSAVFTVRTAFWSYGQLTFALFDDSMISMRYARNLADGAGLRWNPGQVPVEGYSNFLWTMWMSVLHRLGLPDSLAALPVIMSSTGFLALNVIVIHRIALLLAPQRRYIATASAWATAMYYPLSYWSLRGMEVGFAAALLSCSVLVAIMAAGRGLTRSRAIVLGVLAAALVLTRDDLIVPVTIIMAYVVWQARPRRSVLGLLWLLPTLALISHLIFRIVYYGSPLPNTYYLKLDGFSLAERTARGAVVVAHTALLELAVPAVVAGLYIVTRRGRIPHSVTLLMSLLGGQIFYALYVGGDAWESFGFSNRFVAPVAPFLFIIAALGADSLACAGFRWLARAALPLMLSTLVFALGVIPLGRIQIEVRPWSAIIVPFVSGLALVVIGGLSPRREPQQLAFPLIAVVLIGSVGVVPYSRWMRHNAPTWSHDVVRARYGMGLRQCTPPGIAIAIGAAGNIPYFNRRPSVDVLGKSDPAVAKSRPLGSAFLPGHNKRNYEHSVGRLRPNVLGEMYWVTEVDLERFAAWGYLRLGTANVWYLPGGGVDPAKLAAAVAVGIDGRPRC